MPVLIVTRGLPGCGKSTRAREWVAEDPARRARVNRDDLRAMCHNSAYIARSDDTKGTEPAVTVARDTVITALLRAGVSVVCDDTNLPSRTVRGLRKLAATAGANFTVWDMTDVPVETCLERDARRNGSAQVGFAVIRRMHERYVKGRSFPLPVPTEDAPSGPVPYVPDTDLPRAWLVDIDGTLAKMSSRSPYDWHRVGEDDVNPAVYDALHSFAGQAEIILLSGRDGSCRAETEKWLADNGVPFDELHMRAAGDMRRDAIVKAELFDAHVRGRYNVVGVLDDRDQVVEMWRAMGLACFQVAPGDF